VTLEAVWARAKVVEGWRRGGGEVVVDEGKRNSTVDGVDVELKLRCPHR
jgi:hypothetical protein